MSGYVWHSSSSDVTGQNLAKALDWLAGSKSPDFTKHDVVLGWGCKAGTKYSAQTAKERIEQGKLRVLNPVERVEFNRDKLAALEKLRKAGIPVTPFVARLEGQGLAATIKKAIEDGELDFPLLGHNRRHKGQPVFIQTMEDISAAVDDPNIDYVRMVVPGTEYRLHIALDRIICAQVKTPTEKPAQEVSAQVLARMQRGLARAKLPPVPPQVAGWVGEWVANQLIGGSSRILRSVGHGWELKDANLKELSNVTSAAAIAAMDTLGLDLGAVSVEVSGNNFCVSSVTTAPALTDAQVQMYAAALKEFVNAAPKKAAAAFKAAPIPADAQPEVLLARIRRKLRFAGTDKLQKMADLLGE